MRGERGGGLRGGGGKKGGGDDGGRYVAIEESLSGNALKELSFREVLIVLKPYFWPSAGASSFFPIAIAISFAFFSSHLHSPSFFFTII